MAIETEVRAKAFAPGHITGFFEIHDHEDPHRKGSTGCGIVLNGGVTTTVTVSPSIEQTEVFLDGKAVEGRTSRTVLEMITDFPVKVECTSEIPIGCGFGASGAGALGTAYALNQALSLSKTVNSLTEFAHVAEVVNKSGLGDIAGQSTGGLVIRTHPGGPQFGKVDRIPVHDAMVFCIVLGEISTGSVLSDEVKARKINASGKKAMKELMKKPTLENFMAQAKHFSSRTGLLSSKAKDVIEAVEAVGGLASQAMLGDTVFAIAPPGQEFRTYECLEEFGDVLEYGISACVPKLIYD